MSKPLHEPVERKRVAEACYPIAMRELEKREERGEHPGKCGAGAVRGLARLGHGPRTVLECGRGTKGGDG